MRTQQEIINEVMAFPIFQQFEIVEKIQHNIKRSIKPQVVETQELSVEEKMAIVESLGGSLKMKNPPMTKNAERKVIEDYLEKKYK